MRIGGLQRGVRDGRPPVREAQGGAGFQGVDPGVDRAGSPDGLAAEVAVDGERVELVGEVGEPAEGLEFGGEAQPAAVGGQVVVERLHARVVGEELQRGLRALVDQRDREHALKACGERVPVQLVQRQQHVPVAVTVVEGMAPGGEFGPQLPVVVDLAIEDAGQLPAHERLVAGADALDLSLDVYKRQPQPRPVRQVRRARLFRRRSSRRCGTRVRTPSRGARRRLPRGRRSGRRSGGPADSAGRGTR